MPSRITAKQVRPKPKGLLNSGAGRILFFSLGSILLALYGTSLNLAPVDFAALTGLYIATHVVSFQVANYLFFQTSPTTGVMVSN